MPSKGQLTPRRPGRRCPGCCVCLRRRGSVQLKGRCLNQALTGLLRPLNPSRLSHYYRFMVTTSGSRRASHGGQSWRGDAHRELLRWVRRAVAALTIVDLIYFMTAHVFAPGGPSPIRTIQNLLGYAAILLSLARPQLGAWLGIIVAGACLLDVPTANMYPLTFVGISMLWATAPRQRLAAPTLGYVLVVVGAFVSPALNGAAELFMMSAMLAGLLVGYGTRVILERLRRGERRLVRLRRQQRTLEIAEHQLVVSHIQGEIQETLENQWRRAEASSRLSDEHQLWAALDRTEAASRYALGLLRSLVSSLRSSGASSGRLAVESVCECLEDVEDELIAHGYDTRLEVTGDLNDLNAEISSAACQSLHWGVSDFLQHAQPGATVSLRAERSRAALRLIIDGQRTQDRPPESVEAEPIPEMLIDHLSPVDGTATYVPSGHWYLEIVIPRSGEGRSGFASASGTRWLRIAKWVGAAIACTGLIALVLLMVLARSEFTPEVVAAAAVCLATLLALLGLPGARMIGIASALVSLLSRSPWPADLVMIGGWAVAVVYRGHRPLTLAVSLLTSGYVAVRLVTHGIYLALFLAVLLFGTLLAVDAFARRADQTAEVAARLVRENEALREQVRRELAGELHDVAAFQLSRIVLTAESVRLGNGPSPREALVAMADALRTTQMELKLLATLLIDSNEHGPHPSEIVTLAAKSLVGTLESHGHRPVISLDSGLGKTNPHAQHLIVRILRESATNILRYAPEACRCSFRVANQQHNMLIEIRSPLSKNAVSPLVASMSSGFGIAGLEERVRTEGGSFEAGPVGNDWVVRACLASVPLG